MKKFLFLLLILSTFNLPARAASFLEGLGLDTANEPPLVEEAFQFDAVVDDNGTILARWQVMEGNYLYRDKLRFEITPATIKLAPLRLPAGEKKQDETFGLVEVYHHDIELPIAYSQNAATEQPVTLTAYFQGCSETFGICYPPSQQQVTLTLPSTTANTATTEADAVNSSAIAPINKAANTPAVLAEQDKIAQTLVDGKLFTIIASFLGLGLLLTFTPCVLPMVPILSSLIVGEGQHLTTRRAFALSLVYVLAMSVTYTLAGVLTGLLGANLQALLQNIWVLSLFSLLFVLLALSMFGLYQIQLPSALRNKVQQLNQQQARGKFLGVAIMGLLSALIVGPCLAPPLAGALIFISQTADPFLGGLALFALSLGMGIPLLIIGTSAGRLLPKSGRWMLVINHVFGVLLLGLAIWMLERVIPSWVSLSLWGTLLIVSAVYMGALTAVQAKTTGWQKLCKGLGLVLILYGSLLIIGAAGGSQTLWQPLASFKQQPQSQPTGLQFQTIHHMDELQTLLAHTQQPVMLDFYADWCVECKIMERTTFQDPRVIAALADYQLVQLDMTENNDAHQAMLKQLKVFGPPSLLFFTQAGEELRQHRIVGQISADDLLERLAALP